jgi:hypothetical protein
MPATPVFVFVREIELDGTQFILNFVLEKIWIKKAWIFCFEMSLKFALSYVIV